MRPATVLLLALVCAIALASGCSSYNKGKLEGTKWVSVPTTIKNVELERGDRVLEFKKENDDLVYVVKDSRGQERTLTGKWEYNAGHFVTLKFDQTLNDRKRHVEKIEISPDGDRLKMTDSDGTSVTFERAQPEVKPAD